MSPGLALAVDAGWLLVPAALLCSMFCARRGVERGRALAGGIGPGLLVFGAGIFAAGWAAGFTPVTCDAAAPAIGWLLLAAFAVLRAEPPAPSGVGIAWTLAAGTMGALAAGGRTEMLGNVGGLGLYVWWSAGWRRATGFALAAVAGGVLLAWPQISKWYVSAVDGSSALVVFSFLLAAWLGYLSRRWMPAPAAEPETPGRVPMAAARGMVGGLAFFAWMGVPGVIGGFLRHERTGLPWANVLPPLSVAAGLVLTDWLEGRRKPAEG